MFNPMSVMKNLGKEFVEAEGASAKWDVSKRYASRAGDRLYDTAIHAKEDIAAFRALPKETKKELGQTALDVGRAGINDNRVIAGLGVAALGAGAIANSNGDHPYIGGALGVAGVGALGFAGARSLGLIGDVIKGSTEKEVAKSVIDSGKKVPVSNLKGNNFNINSQYSADPFIHREHDMYGTDPTRYNDIRMHQLSMGTYPKR